MSRAAIGGGWQQSSLRFLSCEEEYFAANAGSCIACYYELKIEFQDLQAKVAFLRLSGPFDSQNADQRPSVGFYDVMLVCLDEFQSNPVPIQAHKAVLYY